MKTLVHGLVVGTALVLAPFAQAVPFDAVLCVSGSDLELKLDAMGDGVFEVHGIIPECLSCTPSRNMVLSGTAFLQPDSTLRLGLTIHNVDPDFVPVAWDLVVDISTLEGAGYYEWLTAGEQFGSLLVEPGPCPIVEKGRTVDPAALGRRPGS